MRDAAGGENILLDRTINTNRRVKRGRIHTAGRNVLEIVDTAIGKINK